MGSGLLWHKICSNTNIRCGDSCPSIPKEVHPPPTYPTLGMGCHQATPNFLCTLQHNRNYMSRAHTTATRLKSLTHAPVRQRITINNTQITLIKSIRYNTYPHSINNYSRILSRVIPNWGWAEVLQEQPLNAKFSSSNFANNKSLTTSIF